MPSINEVIERVGRVKPDTISDETKAAWLIALDGRLFQEVILRHRLTQGRKPRGPVPICPACESAGRLRWDRVMDSNACPFCGWTDLPDYPRNFPEDGDKPLLVGAPYDGLYDLHLMAQADFYYQESENYNNSALAFNTALDRWKKEYHRNHEPIGAGPYTNLA